MDCDPRHDNCSGAVYRFNVDRDGNWKQTAKYTASDCRADAWFGGSVALSGDALLVGAQQDDDAAPNAGSAYVFDVGGSR